METKIIETSGNAGNWGKFLVARFTDEWQHPSALPENAHLPVLPLCGWDQHILWVADLQTGEGALFRPGGYATADLEKHRIWVCPMFEGFLAWLYQQDLTDLQVLPDYVALPAIEFALSGYRRPGPKAEP